MTKKRKIDIPKITDNDMLIVKVGTRDRPATVKDIKDVQQLLIKAREVQDCLVQDQLTIVTHHAIEFITLNKQCLKNIIVTGH